MRRLIALSALLSAFAATFATFANAAPVDFQIVHQNITVDRAAGTAQFTIVFNQPPDFTNGPGGQADAFQYEIDANSTNLKKPFGVADVDAVIRGGEISDAQTLPVRSGAGDGGPDSGGWGPVRAVLPFQLNDSTIKFTAPLADLGDTTGEFRFRAFTTRQGAITSQAVGAVIPLPGVILPGALMLGVIAVTRRSRLMRRLV